MKTAAAFYPLRAAPEAHKLAILARLRGSRLTDVTEHSAAGALLLLSVRYCVSLRV